MKQRPRWGYYECLRPDQIASIREQVALAYLPWGALEWHSYHNPVGLDGLLARGLCQTLAQQTGGVVLPPIYAGTDTIKPYKGFGYTLEHDAATVRQLGIEFISQLLDEGFRVIVLITGHCGGSHVAALHEAVATVADQQPDTGLLLVPAFEPIQDTYPANHAARGETSFQLLFDPDPVDLALLPPDRETTLDEDGVWGEDPRSASAKEGQAMLELFVERTLPTIHDLLSRHAS